MHRFFFRQYGAGFIALRFWLSKAVPAKPQNNCQCKPGVQVCFLPFNTDGNIHQDGELATPKQ